MWDDNDFLNCNINAINASFASEKLKSKLLNILNS
jgi:adenosine deaminase